MKENEANQPQIVIRQEMSRSEYRKAIQSTASGDLIRLKNGVYATPNVLYSSVINIDKIVADGILCLYSAWSIYRLTTQIPDAFYVAIKNKRIVRLPTEPVIKLVYVSDSIVDLGATYIEEYGFRLRIYDMERSVCDAIKYRNKIGIDVMAEILNTYLSREGRNVKKLSEYAEKLRVKNILNNYLDVKL